MSLPTSSSSVSSELYPLSNEDQLSAVRKAWSDYLVASSQLEHARKVMIEALDNNFNAVEGKSVIVENLKGHLYKIQHSELLLKEYVDYLDFAAERRLPMDEVARHQISGPRLSEQRILADVHQIKHRDNSIASSQPSKTSSSNMKAVETPTQLMNDDTKIQTNRQGKKHRSKMSSHPATTTANNKSPSHHKTQSSVDAMQTVAVRVDNCALRINTSVDTNTVHALSDRIYYGQVVQFHILQDCEHHLNQVRLVFASHVAASKYYKLISRNSWALDRLSNTKKAELFWDEITPASPLDIGDADQATRTVSISGSNSDLHKLKQTVTEKFPTIGITSIPLPSSYCLDVRLRKRFTKSKNGKRFRADNDQRQRQHLQISCSDTAFAISIRDWLHQYMKTADQSTLGQLRSVQDWHQTPNMRYLMPHNTSTTDRKAQDHFEDTYKIDACVDMTLSHPPEYAECIKAEVVINYQADQSGEFDLLNFLSAHSAGGPIHRIFATDKAIRILYTDWNAASSATKYLQSIGAGRQEFAFLADTFVISYEPRGPNQLLVESRMLILFPRQRIYLGELLPIMQQIANFKTVENGEHALIGCINDTACYILFRSVSSASTLKSVIDGFLFSTRYGFQTACTYGPDPAAIKPEDLKSLLGPHEHLRFTEATLKRVINFLLGQDASSLICPEVTVEKSGMLDASWFPEEASISSTTDQPVVQERKGGRWVPQTICPTETNDEETELVAENMTAERSSVQDCSHSSSKRSRDISSVPRMVDVLARNPQIEHEHENADTSIGSKAEVVMPQPESAEVNMLDTQNPDSVMDSSGCSVM